MIHAYQEVLIPLGGWSKLQDIKTEQVEWGLSCDRLQWWSVEAWLPGEGANWATACPTFAISSHVVPIVELSENHVDFSRILVDAANASMSLVE